MRREAAVMTLALIVAATGPACFAQDLPQIGGVVNFQQAQGTVLVNGIPAVRYGAADAGGGRGMDVTDWLADGVNEIRLSVDQAGDPGDATLELVDAATGDRLLSLEQHGVGEAAGSVELSGLPDWAWMTATAAADDSGLASAVAALHEAYGASDIERIVALCAPFFADQELLGGMSAADFSARAAPMLEAGQLQPLPGLSIESYSGGKLFRVSGPDGEPPIQVEMKRGGQTNSLKTGEWWSMIDGSWQVVR